MMNKGSPLDRALAALAHPVRREILQQVMRKESRITELAGPFAMSLNAVSKHIRMLERAHLVRRRTAWREHWVSYNPHSLDDVAGWVEATRAFWNSRLDSLDALLKAEDAASAKPLSTEPTHEPR